MSDLENWVQIPLYATPISSTSDDEPSQHQLNVTTSNIPTPAAASVRPQSPRQASSTSLNLASVVISSALNVPSAAAPSSPRKTAGKLLSTRDQLSIPITAVNFRRFVSKSGSIFWLQDRVEEIIMWRKGWRVTGAWMATYAFLCFFPRLVLLIPHVAVLSILLITYRTRYPQDGLEQNPQPPWRPTESREGSSEWFANLQAIQNLMGFYADAYESVMPVMPHIAHATPFTAPLMVFLLVTLLLSLPILALLPLRPIFLVVGLAPFAITHPTSLHVLPKVVTPLMAHFEKTIQEWVDNDRLSDQAWSAPLQEVELFENERWAGSTAGGSSVVGWSKVNLRSGERLAWTRRKDGWSDAATALVGKEKGDPDLKSLNFTLESGWAFVETADWRQDLLASWVPHIGADENGWVYTNDTWSDAHNRPAEEWKGKGMTRRRRWYRRIYYTKPQSKS